MKASTGEVYTVYNQYLKRYTACQVAYIAPPDTCLLYTSPSPRDRQKSRMPSSA